MKKKTKIILIILMIILATSTSYAKYRLKCSAKVFHINELVKEEPLQEPTRISGTIITENYLGIHKSLVTAYKTSDTRAENDGTNPREIIAQTETNEDGSFSLEVEDIEEYDIVVTKMGYLDYRVTNIKVKEKEETLLTEHLLKGGDVVYSGVIDISDLTKIKEHKGIVITDEDRLEVAICDLNEDGIIDDLDVDILRKNYRKGTETVKWTL